jgi:Asp-tRNA(Asn)/Glu-tRNA(Gln) amidotransferase A subunit family amidase
VRPIASWRPAVAGRCGIPISLKDIIDLPNADDSGFDATSRDPVAADALVTRRLKAAGAVIVG